MKHETKHWKKIKKKRIGKSEKKSNRDLEKIGNQTQKLKMK